MVVLFFQGLRLHLFACDGLFARQGCAAVPAAEIGAGSRRSPATVVLVESSVGRASLQVEISAAQAVM